ncbi:sensor histidine kinase [Parasphingorhabdus marina]|nr:sensor histidine kinase [Parasphingorhabdus marina]
MLAALLCPGQAIAQISSPDRNGIQSSPTLRSTSTIAIPVIPLYAGSDGPPLAPYIRYARHVAGDAASENWDNLAPDLLELNVSKIQFGPGGPNTILVRFRVQNASAKQGTWLLTTGRGAMKDFKLAERVNGQTRLLIDGTNLEQVRELLHLYHSFTHVLELAPGEEREFALSFQGVHSTLLPLAIQTNETFIEQRYWNIALIAGGVLGLLSLAIIMVIFYSTTGRPEFLWLGLADLMLTAYILHIPGYTTFYFLYDKSIWIFAIGLILPSAHAFFCAQFARVFLKTSVNFPVVNKVLIGLMLLWAFVSLRRTYLALNDLATDTAWLDTVTVLSIAMSQIMLPSIAILAVIRMGSQYWPLIVAWGGWALFNIYALSSTIALVPGLPFNWHYVGIAALLSALFATLALALHIRRVHIDKLVYERGLNKSLQKQIEIQEDAIRLEREKASAIATINDQDNLIHASGHDSQQVLMALNSIANVTEKMPSDALPSNLGDLLKSSASYLQDIVSTTTSGAISGFENSSFIALTRFRFAELIQPIEMIYRPLFIKKQIELKVDIRSDHWIVSDRALLARVLSNLLSNSLKFTQRGEVTLTAWTEHRKAVLEVRDTGIGMDPDLLSRLGGPQEGRVKIRDGEGSGFGLLSSRTIISRLFGTLEIDSRKGSGTTITVSLPLSDAKRAEPVPANGMKNIVSQIALVDVDEISRREFEDQHLCMSCGDRKQDNTQIIPVTHDNSASMRSWIGSFSDLGLVKPVWSDMLDHPAVQNVQNRAYGK